MSLSGLAHTESTSATAAARYTPCAKQQQQQRRRQRIVPFEQHVCVTQFLPANSYRIIYERYVC